MSLVIAFVLGCVVAIAVAGLLASKGKRAPQAPKGLVRARGMQGRQATQLWQAACERGLAACVVVLAEGTYGVIIAGRVYGGAPQAREAIDRATSERLWA